MGLTTPAIPWISGLNVPELPNKNVPVHEVTTKLSHYHFYLQLLADVYRLHHVEAAQVIMLHIHTLPSTNVIIISFAACAEPISYMYVAYITVVL